MVTQIVTLMRCTCADHPGDTSRVTFESDLKQYVAEIHYIQGSWQQNAYVVYVQATTALNFSHAVLLRKNPIKEVRAKIFQPIDIF